LKHLLSLVSNGLFVNDRATAQRSNDSIIEKEKEANEGPASPSSSSLPCYYGASRNWARPASYTPARFNDPMGLDAIAQKYTLRYISDVIQSSVLVEKSNVPFAIWTFLNLLNPETNFARCGVRASEKGRCAALTIFHRRLRQFQRIFENHDGSMVCGGAVAGMGGRKEEMDLRVHDHNNDTTSKRDGKFLVKGRSKYDGN